MAKFNSIFAEHIEGFNGRVAYSKGEKRKKSQGMEWRVRLKQKREADDLRESGARKGRDKKKAKKKSKPKPEPAPAKRTWGGLSFGGLIK